MQKSRRGRTITSTALLLLALAIRAIAQPAEPVRSGPVEARLIADQASVLPGKSFTVGLLLRMDPDWHVYWKNPGESGLPTMVEWVLPPGFTAGPLQWPIPQRIETLGLVTYGYAGEVLLLSEITPPASLRAGQAIALSARAGWLACRVECTPGSAKLDLSLPVELSEPLPSPQWEAVFRQAKALLPSVAPSVRITAEADMRQIILRAEGVPVAAGARAFFFPAAAGSIKDSAPQKVEESGSLLTLRLERAEAGEGSSRLQGLLVVSGPGQPLGIEVDTPLAAPKPHPAVALPAGARPGLAGFLLALILAFAGGILLNLMPCVLPIVSLKVLSFIRQSEGKTGTGLRHGLFFTAGVLVSFWSIAGILVALRAGGQLLGWGFQLQDPTVLAITAALFFLIGLNLFGVFEIGSSLTRLGSLLVGRSGNAGAFFSGLLATAVATPCTAPFMGSALGYALTRSVPVAFGVFTALALGMSAPSLLIAGLPRLIARMPKQGPWMETLRHLLGFPMMGAAIWMLFVLSALTGPSAVIWVLAALLLCGLGVWIWGHWGGIERPRGLRIVSGLLALLFVVGSMALAIGFIRDFPPRDTANLAPVTRQAIRPASSWEAWSPQRVVQLRQQGEPVFIDFTAQWCLSCQVNERVALDHPEVRARFADLGVATLRADWTDRNDAIAQAIAGFGRAGIPLYAYYARGASEPVLLPELLTPGIVLGALGKPR